MQLALLEGMQDQGEHSISRSAALLVHKTDGLVGCREALQRGICALQWLVHGPGDCCHRCTAHFLFRSACSFSPTFPYCFRGSSTLRTTICWRLGALARLACLRGSVGIWQAPLLRARPYISSCVL